jgi:streptogramin lyase
MHFSDAGWKFRSVSGAKDSMQKQKRRRAQQFALESLESRCLLSSIAEFPTPKLSSGSLAQPAEITSAGGKLWITESGGAIGVVDPANAGTVVSYSQGMSSSAGPQGITVGRDKNIWFTETTAGAIGMLNTSNPTSNIQNYTQGLLARAHPFGITSVPGGNVWFTDPTNNAIGWINPSSPNPITEIQVPSSLVGITDFGSQITAGPGGKLYFTEAVLTIGAGGAITITSSAIGIYDPAAPPANPWSQVSLPSGQEPFGIALGPDQSSLWYTWEIPTSVGSGPQSSGIGTFNALAPPSTIPPGSSFQLTTPSGGVTPQPNRITSGPDGLIWLTDSGNGAIYSIDPTSHVISAPNFIGKTVISNPLPTGITTGPDGNLWFTDDGQQVPPTASGAYGRVTLDTQLAITAQPPAGVTTGNPFGLTAKVQYSDTGAVDTAYTGNVAIALTNPASNILGGTTTVPASAGVATFTTLTLANAGTGFTLTATAGGLTSAPTTGINVTAPAPQATQLLVSTQPPASVSAGNPFSLVIVALTSSNALDASYSGTVTLTLSPLATNPPGSFLGGTTTVTASGGIANFSGLTLNLPGSYVIQATASGLSSASTTAITVPVPTPPPAPHIQGVTVLTTQKTNKKGKPIGKPVLNGYQFTFDTAMSSGTGNSANYKLGTYVQVTMKVGKKKVKVLNLQPIGFRLNYVSSNRVQLILNGKQAFKLGGQITLVAAGISSAAGGFLGGNAVYNIAKGGFGISHA